MSALDGKSILVTGATGSFGKRFVKHVIEKRRPKHLVVFSRDELKQFEMQQWLKAPNLQYVLGDVRDKERLYQVVDGIDVVVHAAAMKQVPASETNPMEAIKTNIIGAENIINVCIDHGVERVIALSTDKAANPTNLYGATKLCSDKLFVAANGLARKRKTRFAVVRYGNVVGSRGSVIPFFMQRRKSGRLPITDARMTRFWITLNQGVQFVISSLDRMCGGEVFVPKIPSMNIMEVAKAVGPDCQHDFIGIRPGEKLHEIMITEDDSWNTLEFPDHYVIQPAADWWDKNGYLKATDGVPVADGFFYRSDKNNLWMDAAQLSELLAREPIEL